MSREDTARWSLGERGARVLKKGTMHCEKKETYFYQSSDLFIDEFEYSKRLDLRVYSRGYKKLEMSS